MVRTPSSGHQGVQSMDCRIKFKILGEKGSFLTINAITVFVLN